VRNRQIEHLMTVLARETLPYIVAGDFNTSDQSLIYPRIASLMGDSFREAGFGFGTSWPVSAAQRETFGFLPPLVRIDYIWHSRDWVATQAAQGPPLGSDHLALTATLALNGSR
jgi:endonuclease/exonuclease/phosphatase (EEP) superfamily protein YafD